MAPRFLARVGRDGYRVRPKLVRAPRFESPLPAGALDAAPDGDVGRLLRAADEILAGRWKVLGVTQQDMVAPDWFLDPLSGRRAPQAEYCFSIDHRDEGVTGNAKKVWELSRHHHLTVLAAAYALTGDRRYAERAGSHLRSWWQENPSRSLTKSTGPTDPSPAGISPGPTVEVTWGLPSRLPWTAAAHPAVAGP